YTAEEQAFAEEVRAFLQMQPPESFPEDGMDAGYGSGPHSRAFLRALASRGWLSMCWPRQYGGQEQPMNRKLIPLEELGAGGAAGGPVAIRWPTLSSATGPRRSDARCSRASRRARPPSGRDSASPAPAPICSRSRLVDAATARTT